MEDLYEHIKLVKEMSKMPYSLKRERDGAGDSGTMSKLFIPIYNSEGKLIDMREVDDARPQVGSVLRVGSNFARSYSAQDWWQTTIITEILEDTINEDGSEYVRFRTGNSIYEWRKF
jgi:hypothetical protein